MLDVFVRPTNLCKIYQGPYHSLRDQKCLSISRLQVLLELFPLNVENLDADFKSALLTFERVSVDSPVSSRVLNILKKSLPNLKVFEVDILDPNLATFMQMEDKYQFIKCYEWGEDYFKNRCFSKNGTLDFGLFLTELSSVEQITTHTFVKHLFFSCLAFFEAVEFTHIDSKYLQILADSYRPFRSILFHPFQYASCSPDLLTKFLKRQTELRIVSFPLDSIPKDFSIHDLYLENVTHINLSACTTLDFYDYSILIPRLSKIQSLILPLIRNIEVFQTIERFCSNLYEIGLTNPGCLGVDLGNLLKRLCHKLTSLMVYEDHGLDLHEFSPSLIMRNLKIIDCQLSPFSTIFQLGAIYPHLERLDLKGCQVKIKEVECFRIVYPGVAFSVSNSKYHEEYYRELLEDI